MLGPGLRLIAVDTSDHASDSECVPCSETRLKNIRLKLCIAAFRCKCKSHVFTYIFCSKSEAVESEDDDLFTEFALRALQLSRAQHAPKVTHRLHSRHPLRAET